MGWVLACLLACLLAGLVDHLVGWVADDWSVCSCMHHLGPQLHHHTPYGCFELLLLHTLCMCAARQCFMHLQQQGSDFTQRWLRSLNRLIAATAGGMPDSCGSLQRLSDGGGQTVPEDYVLQDTTYLLGYADSEHPHDSHFCHDAVQ